MSIKALEKVGGALVPPGIDPTTMWRLTVSLSIFALILWVFWAMGALTALGAPGLARADEQTKMLAELYDAKVERLVAGILQSQREFCLAEKESRPRAFYLEQRNKKLNEYYATTKVAYQGLPACDEL